MPRPRRVPANLHRPSPNALIVIACSALVMTIACGDAAQATAGGQAASSATSSPMSAERDASQDTIVVHAGDAYETSDFKTTYLGMAKLPLGNGNVRTDGTCVTLLFEATYLASPGGRAVFRPSAKGYFSDGREAENDNTGVGCGVAGVKALGYESRPRRNRDVRRIAGSLS